MILVTASPMAKTMLWMVFRSMSSVWQMASMNARATDNMRRSLGMVSVKGSEDIGSYPMIACAFSIRKPPGRPNKLIIIFPINSEQASFSTRDAGLQSDRAGRRGWQDTTRTGRPPQWMQAANKTEREYAAYRAACLQKD